MKSFEQFKRDMSDEYPIKVKEVAKAKNVQAVGKVCDACGQLEFDHKPGVCTRSRKADKSGKYTPEQLDEIVDGVMKDVVAAIVEDAKSELDEKTLNVDESKNADSLANAFNNLAEVLKQQKQTPSQVTKVKIPPTWAKESFLDYKAEVEAWEHAHPGDDYAKYSEFMNELKRNKTRVGLSDFVSTVVVDKTRNAKTVKDILEVLEDKYELTKKEKFENLVDMIKNFKPNKGESGERIFSQIEKIETEFHTLEIGKNLKYFLATLFVKATFENDVINEMEKRAVQELIEKNEENSIMNEVKKEFKKIKIEGKREIGVNKTENEESKLITQLVIMEDLDMILGKVLEILKISNGVVLTTGDHSLEIDGDVLSLNLFQDQDRGQLHSHEDPLQNLDQ